MIPVLPRHQACADCLNLSAIEYAQLIGAGLFLAPKPASTLQEIPGDSSGSIRRTHRLAIISPVCGGGYRAGGWLGRKFGPDRADLDGRIPKMPRGQPRLEDPLSTPAHRPHHSQKIRRFAGLFFEAGGSGRNQLK
jgi:hypothetical protein